MMNNSEIKDKILDFVHSVGITEAGIASDEKTFSAVVCLFPYFKGICPDANISLYAYTEDYHTVVKSYLKRIEEFILSLCPDAKIECFADIGPERDKQLAHMAGLGIYGENSLLINERYGSFVFIGYVMTDLMLPPDSARQEGCLKCGACRKACPGGALDSGFCSEKCASHISQKRGELTEEETKILLKSGLVWGCDVCQSVCPLNKKAEHTPLPEFSKNLIYRLDFNEISVMSNSEFKEKFKNRAFAWRGRNVLKRNLKIFEDTK